MLTPRFAPPGFMLLTETPPSANAIDFAAILQASHALSRTIQLDELPQQLTQVMLHHSGADHCALILPDDRGDWQVAASSQRQPMSVASPMLPLALIQQVSRTQTAIVINAGDTDLPIDDDLRPPPPPTLLILPIVNQGELLGILDLRHQTISGGFTPDCVLILNFLCTQAAIALSNARLFQASQQTALKLQQANAFLEAQRECSLDGILVVDQHRQINAFNQRFLDLWQIPPALSTTRDDHQMLAFVVEQVSDSHVFLDQVLYLYDHIEESSHCEIALNDGRTIERTSVPVNTAEGDHCGRIWYFRDISNRQAAATALIESEAYHRNLFNQSTIGLQLCRMDGSMVYANAAYAQILGRTPEATAALTYWEITPEKYAAAEQQQLQSLQATSRYGPYEKEYIHQDGRLIPVRLSGVLVERYGEQFIWSSIEDITDRKAAESVIQQKSRELEQAVRALQQAQLQMVQSEKMSALGNLVAGVAHEINNPIGCIVGNVGAAQDYINDLLGVIDLYAQKFPQPGPEIAAELATIDLEYLREDLPKLIRAMRDGGDRIKSISRSLRTFSRADTDVKQLFNLHDGIDSTVLILRHRLKANDRRPEIPVVTDYGKIPAVECFPGQLNQVFMNIIANAIDALDENNFGHRFVDIQAHPNQITIQTIQADNQVRITIRDNGPGMSEAVRAQVFDHLFTTKDVGKGTGLGLAIAHQIVVQKHHGSLTVQSELGQGTAFMIHLPIAAAHD
jgi:PAS domain S-box-containing protein